MELFPISIYFVSWVMCIFTQSLKFPNNPTFDSLKEHYGNQKQQDNSCLKNTDYDMGQVCNTNNYIGFMPAVEAFLRRQKSLVDHTYCLPKCYTPPEQVDFVVIGSGVGSVVARRLADKGYNVAILEAGGPAPVGTQIPGTYFQYIGDPDVDWNFKLEKEENACLSQGGVCHWPRGKMMGGTTQLHGMMYMRGYPQDYNNLKIPGWSWYDVLPYFLASEDNQQIGTHADPGNDNGFPYHSTGGLLTVSRFPDHPDIAVNILQGAAELGYNTGNDMNGAVRTGFTLAQATVRNGERLSTSRAYLYDPAPKKPIHIITNAFVERITFDGNRRASGITYEKDGKTWKIKVKKEVIVSAGSVQSPQILMVSGIGPKDKLEKYGISMIHDLPGVGENLRNHGSISIDFKVKNDPNVDQLNIDTLEQYLQSERKGPLTSTGLSQLTGFLYSSNDIDETEYPPDLQMFFAGFLAGCSENGSIYGQPQTIRRISMTPTLLRPKSIGYLELASSNPKVQPKIRANLLKEKEDIDELYKGVQIALKLYQTNALKNLLEIEPKPCPGVQTNINSEEYWKCVIRYYTNPENHQVGTCKMGNDNDPMAVTDARLLVRGLENVRVIDSSVLPTVPSGNLVAPAIMVAEKGAQMIIDDHSKTKNSYEEDY